MNRSYISPKVKTKKSDNGLGVFAVKKISAGELITDYTNGTGKYIKNAEAKKFFNEGFDYMLQVSDNLYFAATRNNELEPGDYINHSCNPNCGIKGRIKIVAMRNIKPDEEITFDYAMSESSNYRMKCNCGSQNCRGVITGDDWKIPALQKRYEGFFSEYLQKKIKRLKK